MQAYKTRAKTFKNLVEDESGVIEEIDFSLPGNKPGEVQNFSYNSTASSPNIQVQSLKNQQLKK